MTLKTSDGLIYFFRFLLHLYIFTRLISCGQVLLLFLSLPEL